MKIFLTYSINTLPDHISLFRRYFSDNAINFTEKEFPADPTKVDLQEAQDLYNRNTRNFNAADIICTELSFVSNDTGYYISEALQQRKPVIVFII